MQKWQDITTQFKSLQVQAPVPENLNGKQFKFLPKSDSVGIYEIIGYYTAKDNTIMYNILFKDCDDPIQVGGEEIRHMLEESIEVET